MPRRSIINRERLAARCDTTAGPLQDLTLRVTGSEADPQVELNTALIEAATQVASGNSHKQGKNACNSGI
jgi:hypothetical protein